MRTFALSVVMIFLAGCVTQAERAGYNAVVLT